MDSSFRGGKVAKTSFKTYMTTSSYSDISKWYDSVSIRICSYSHCCKDDEKSKEYYINEKKKTIVLKWNDDTITKVKVSENDKFDARYGFLIAYFQKHCGMSKTKANKYLDNLQNNLEKTKIESEAKLVQAEAEAKANELKKKTITKELIEQQFIEKWNGELPKVTSGNSYFDISKLIN